ncbi:helix-turn-helix domain-containing protein [Hallella multisaccharivorax]|uniref:helix-turn-helix domain-containing protein n=1 Tax=Hallella multisaccharivorax TaxID=310514 RepID=UPI0036165283
MNNTMPSITIDSVKQASQCLSLGQDLAIIDDVKSITTPDKPKRLGCFIFAFCDKGSVRYVIDTMQQTVTAGHCIIMSYGQVIEKVSIGPDCEGHTVVISQEYVQEVLSGMRDLSSIFLFSRLHPVFSMDREEVRSILSFYLLIRQKTSETTHRFRRDTVKALIQAFLYDAGNIFWKVFNQEDKKNTRAEDIFMEFIELVEKNFRQERRVSWYALQLHITHKYLSESVRQISRKTPNQWIDSYVMLELRVLLRTSTLSIKEIAEKMHFPNQSFLGKYFKQHTGMSPKEYRTC